MISIIMPAYNAQRTIGASIQSVLDQTYTDFELIVINDCSTDDTASILSEFLKDPRIRLLTNSKNSGVAHSRNKGVSASQGEYLAFLDSDDLWHKNKLAHQLEFMKEQNAVISYTSTAHMDADSNMYDYVMRAKERLTYKEMLRHNLMSCSSVMVKRDAMLPFPEDEQIHEDYVVWLTIVRTVKYAYGLDEPLLIYRMAKGSKSSKRMLSAKMIYNAYRKVGHGTVASSFITLRYSVHSIGKRFKIKGTRL